MNRLILIGNGFDLAYGMKTGYNQFMLSYIKDCFKAAAVQFQYRDIIPGNSYPSGDFIRLQV